MEFRHVRQSETPSLVHSHTETKHHRGRLVVVLAALKARSCSFVQWEGLLKEIIELTHHDNVGDQWISVISEIMKTFPDKSSFNYDLTDQECEGFSDGIQELRKTGSLSPDV